MFVYIRLKNSNDWSVSIWRILFRPTTERRQVMKMMSEKLKAEMSCRIRSSSLICEIRSDANYRCNIAVVMIRTRLKKISRMAARKCTLVSPNFLAAVQNSFVGFESQIFRESALENRRHNGRRRNGIIRVPWPLSRPLERVFWGFVCFTTMAF